MTNISNKQRIGLLVVFWAGATTMGALWAAKGNLIGWFAFVAGLVTVFYTSQLPPENPALKSNVVLGFLLLGFVFEILIILDMSGVLG